MDTKYSHEKSVENIFKYKFEAAARSINRIYTSASLDGQDRIVGADYLFTDHCKYAIVEFKYRENNLPSEIKKVRRHLLCQGLFFDAEARQLHEQCHFAAWSNSTGEITIEANIYFNEVCNATFWGDKFSYISSPDTSTRQTENIFIDNFLKGNEGADFVKFEKYLKWLLELGEDSNTNGYLELIISNPLNSSSAGLSFTSVENMHTWVESNNPNPTIRYTSYGGGPSAP